VQSVPAPLGVARPRVALALAAAVLAAVVVVALPHGKAAPSHRAPVALIGGLPLQQASCAQWNTGTPAERAAVVRVLKRVVGGATGFGPASTLPTGDAYNLFDSTCSRPYAHGFLLYELYTRASAFRPEAQPY
jgi:hypothetical protein